MKNIATAALAGFIALNNLNASSIETFVQQETPVAISQNSSPIEVNKINIYYNCSDKKIKQTYNEELFIRSFTETLRQNYSFRGQNIEGNEKIADFELKYKKKAIHGEIFRHDGNLFAVYDSDFSNAMRIGNYASSKILGDYGKVKLSVKRSIDKSLTSFGCHRSAVNYKI